MLGLDFYSRLRGLGIAEALVEAQGYGKEHGSYYLVFRVEGSQP